MSIPFVQHLRFKLDEIEEIKRRNIFQFLEDDLKRLKRIYKKVTTFNDCLPNDERLSLLSICMSLEDRIDKAKRIYNEMDIVELWDLYSVKLAMNYQDPFMERKDNG